VPGARSETDFLAACVTDNITILASGSWSPADPGTAHVEDVAHRRIEPRPLRPLHADDLVIEAGGRAVGYVILAGLGRVNPSSSSGALS
jgi:hypothetical protein